MTSPEEYHQRLWDIGIMDLQIRVNSDETAKAALAQFRLLKKQLQNMKREVNADIQAIKIKYQSQSMTAGTTGGTVLRGLGLFGFRGMRGLARNYEANSKRGVKYMQNIELEPYNNLKLTIDDLLAQLEIQTAKLQSLMLEQSE